MEGRRVGGEEASEEREVEQKASKVDRGSERILAVMETKTQRVL